MKICKKSSTDKFLLSTKQILFSYGMIVFALLVCLNMFEHTTISHVSGYAIVSFLVNGLLWFIMLINELAKKSYSLLFIIWFFCLYFFFFAGFTQYLNGSFPWISYDYTDSNIFVFNICLLLWSFFLILGTKICRDKHTEVLMVDCTPILKIISTFVFVSIAICVYRISKVGFVNLLSRETSSLSVSDNGSLSMIVDKLLMSMMYFSAAYSILYYRKTKIKLPMMICCFCMLIAYFPTGSSRNVIAGLYLGCFLLMFPSLKHNHFFSILLIFSFMIVFPFLNAFRNTSFVDVDIGLAIKRVIDNLSTEWLAGDYDAYSMFGLTYNYVSDYGSAFGHQLLGVVFFFIPRSIWKTKPYGSGYFIADNLGWNFKNVSCPLPGEMLINFGVIGMLICVLLFGILIKWLDNGFWQNKYDDNFGVFEPLYCYMVGYFLFVCRGDLLSSFAYLSSVIVVWLLINGHLLLRGLRIKNFKCF